MPLLVDEPKLGVRMPDFLESDKGKVKYGRYKIGQSLNLKLRFFATPSSLLSCIDSALSSQELSRAVQVV